MSLQTVSQQVAAAEKRVAKAQARATALREKLIFRGKDKETLAELRDVNTVTLHTRHGYSKDVSFETIEKLYKWFKKHNRTKPKARKA